jgi:hypothetical protein
VSELGGRNVTFVISFGYLLIFILFVAASLHDHFRHCGEETYGRDVSL